MLFSKKYFFSFVVGEINELLQYFRESNLALVDWEFEA